MPPTKTPTARAAAGLEKCFQTAATEKTIKEIFKRIGVAAGGPKIWKQFRIAMAMAAMPMKSMYGNISRFR